MGKNTGRNVKEGRVSSPTSLLTSPEVTEEARKRQRDAASAQYLEQWKKGAVALRERFLYLLDDFAPERGKYQYLESRTGIAASKWQNLYLEKQFPTLEMLLAICSYRRPYSHWLLAGVPPTFDDLSEDTPARKSPPLERWESYQQHRRWVRDRKRK